MKPTKKLFAVAVAVMLAALAVLSLESNAGAYPWMIRHEYSGCGVCHLDPSGGGLMTAYGRAQADLLLRTRYGFDGDEGEVSRSAGFLFGVMEPNETVLPGGSFRFASLVRGRTGEDAAARAFPMQADLGLGIRPGPLRAAATLGYARGAAQPAQVTTSDEHNVISREHWVGLALLEEALLLRAGRMNVPFGIRQPEHTLWAREATGSQTNDAQQHGVAAAFSAGPVRGEALLIAGNFQLGPDALRERGVSTFCELTVASGHALGASARVTRAGASAVDDETALRQAYGLTYRGHVGGPLVVLAEADVLHDDIGEGGLGLTTMVQLDFELTQGVHVMLAGETLGRHLAEDGMSVGGWGSAAWFFLPHLDTRLDIIARRDAALSVSSVTAIQQLHLSL